MPDKPNPFPTPIESQRLVLRSYQAGDGEMYFAAAQRNREHLQRYESGNVMMSLADAGQAETIVRQLAQDWVENKAFFIGLFAKASGAWVGQVYVGPSNWDLPEYIIGYVADVEHEGQGYITEAVKAVLAVLFEQLGALRVRAICDESNQRSYRVMERCGLRREGHFRHNKRLPDGSLTGTYYYAILRQEYQVQS
ncbi:MAG: GNAT family N-acetyltransferase [Anaerolineales bacterium]|nr:GNAT family N-acetyltransferase [Anaerolineales bacterium]